MARYVARYGKGRLSKAVLISAVPPVMVNARLRSLWGFERKGLWLLKKEPKQ